MSEFLLYLSARYSGFALIQRLCCAADRSASLRAQARGLALDELRRSTLDWATYIKLSEEPDALVHHTCVTRAARRQCGARAAPL